MWALIAQAVSFLVGLFMQKKAPAVAERAGAAEARLKDKEVSDAKIDTAVRARDAVAAERLRDSSEAKLRAPNRNSRD